jgi:HSP20 family protein
MGREAKEHTMSALTKRPPSPLAQMIDWLDIGAPAGIRGLGLTPYVRVEDYIEDSTYVVRAELPGVDPDQDVEIDVTGDTLTIKGERREEKNDKRHHEMHYGSFYRSLTLPQGVKAEEVTATYTDGVLEIRVPTGTHADGAHRVPIRKGS